MTDDNPPLPPRKANTNIVTHGNFPSFNPNTEVFDTYVLRFEFYFIARGFDEKLKAANFLSTLDGKSFTLALNLLHPKRIQDASYADIVAVLTTHYKPKVLILYERFQFNSRVQRPSESISDFLAALRNLARTCNYGNALDDLLRDRFVVGLRDQTIQRTLLTMDNVSLKQAVDVAMAREASLRDTIPTFQRPDPDGKNEIRKINSSKNFSLKNANTNSNTAQGNPPSRCKSCGGEHWRQNCRFRNAKCYLCSSDGHIAKVCGKNSNGNKSVRNSKKSRQNTNQVVENTDPAATATYQPDVSYHNVFHVKTNVPPMVYNLEVNQVKIPAELDTGAFYALMSKSTFERTWPNKFQRPKLRDCSTRLTAFGGSEITVLGAIDVKINLDSQEPVESEFIIVQQNGPTLIGRSMMKDLNVSISQNAVNSISNVSVFEKKFPVLFGPGLGCLKNEMFSIEVDASIPPKFCKARPVPYAMREKVSLELDRLLDEKIIIPVKHSKWAAPTVPVLKSNNSLRLCGDYKITCNRAANLDCFPIPKFEDLVSNLANKKFFSKLDLSQAYAQLLLTPESRELTTINTHRGLFQYLRLPYGVSSAPGIFQRAMENLFKDVPDVLCYLDDLLISSETEAAHEKLLNRVFQKLQDSGLKVKPEKCEISVPELLYLGYKITRTGLLPTEDKCRAIKNAPRPTDITQVRSYLGLLNFYRRFIPQAAEVLEPLNRLLKADTPWQWTQEQELAFKKSKEILLNSKALVHFDPKKPIVVSSDSSSYGIGAVLSHKIDGLERPVCFVSRTLSGAERNYPQTEKEALSMVFAMRSFHQYLWGQKFDMVTDHKPLVGLFSPSRSINAQSSGRIQRWGLLLQNYRFDLYHRAGKLLCTADALSRLPADKAVEYTPIPGDWNLVANFLENTPTNCAEIRENTQNDEVLKKVFQFCLEGWPSSLAGDPDLGPYARRRDELSVQDGIILWGIRVIIPQALRSSLLKELHTNHTGSSRMKELARSYLWWPNLDQDLEDVSASCDTCLEHRSMPPKAELHPWEWPKAPWHRIHVDHAGPMDGNYFLVIVDAHSKWTDIYKTNGTTSTETIRLLQHSFSRFGLPVSIVSDNGPCFTSAEFANFTKTSGIRHVTTAVYKPSTNGLAERMVQTFKSALRKSSESVSVSLDRFLFNYRMTPHATTGVTPAELMFGRKLRTRLDLIRPENFTPPPLVSPEEVAEKVMSKQAAQTKNHCSRPRTIELATHTPIMIRNFGRHGEKWLPATVHRQTGPLSYECKLEDGRIFKRHQDQLQLRTRRRPSASPTPPLLVIPEIQAPLNSPVRAPPRSSSLLPRRSTRERKPIDRYGDSVPH